MRRLLLALALCLASRLSVAQTGTLIVSNMNDNTATVLDVATRRVLGTLPTGEGPHEVAASHDGRWAVVTNYGVRGKPGSTITVIDVDRVAVARTIDLKDYQRPHGAAFFPGDTMLVVTSEVSKALLVIDFRTGAVVQTLPTNGRATHMLGVSAKGDRIVTSNIADNTISVFGIADMGGPSVFHVGRQPEGIAIAPDGNTAWVGSNRDSLVVVVDTHSGAALDTIRGFGLPYRKAVSADGKRAVVTDPVNANVRVFDVASRKQRFSIPISRDSLVDKPEVPGSPSPEGIVLSPDSRWAFVTLFSLWFRHGRRDAIHDPARRQRATSRKDVPSVEHQHHVVVRHRDRELTAKARAAPEIV
jgi:YVTN family beta-propeller protein